MKTNTRDRNKIIFHNDRLIQPNGKLIIRADKTPKFPPSIAKKMLDYIPTEGDFALYDPFAGAGTVLYTAALNCPNIRELYGSDFSGDAVVASELNLEFASTNLGNVPSYNLFEANALTVSAPDSKNPLYVVTDPPFGRACNWMNENGEASDNSKLNSFLINMARQSIEGMVLCYDERIPIHDDISKYFHILNEASLKDRAIYNLRTK